MSIVICKDGMCPYIPCSKCPNCVHIDNLIKEKRDKKDDK